MANLVLDNAFWKFSVTVYDAPGVADECLALQDDYGIDVNVLLFCAWLGRSRNIELTAKDIEAIEAVVRPWHAGAVKPLRAVRRFTKGLPEDEIKTLRERIKTIELEAEQIEQAMLHAYAEERWPHGQRTPIPSVITSNLEVFLDAHGCRRQNPDDAPSKRLCAAILAVDVKP